MAGFVWVLAGLVSGNEFQNAQWQVFAAFFNQLKRIKGQLAARFLSECLGLNLFASKPAVQFHGDSVEGFEVRSDESNL